MQVSNLFLIAAVLIGFSAAAPAFLYTALPAPVADTKVFRDYLGNQATSYSYHDGHSSTVALSRNDVSKHFAAPLVAAPVAYAAPAPVAYAAPAPVAYAANSYQYHHQYPSYSAFASPAYYY